MTPLGHAGISLLVGAGIIKVTPSLDPILVLTATTVGGVFLDLDLLYRFYHKGKDVFDKTIGQHRFFPTHTPLYVLIWFLILWWTSLLLGSPKLLTWGAFFTIGAMLHLLLDTLFFPEGINLAYPFSKKMVRFFTIKTHKFWAPKEISNVDNWHINYFKSPLFWASEVLPTLFALVLLSQI
ncbi:MAG: metal-dependent hydrolase [bacterium]|nr:metal-dependent hydrolase [bacterium]